MNSTMNVGNLVNETETVGVGDPTAEEEEEQFVIVYRSLLYLLSLYIAGDIVCGKIIRVIPPLVGQIGIGMLLGPHGLQFLGENVAAFWPLLGEIGLILMLCQAGLEMDFETLRVVGPRGVVMALVGSILPTSIGFMLAYLALNLSPKSALAVGCSFGPTSAGIALNVLQLCGVLKTPLGQLIVAIAIVDDIIALVVLSQLQALTAETLSASAIAIPIVSAFLWLFAGGAIALYIMPKLLTQLNLIEDSFFSRSKSNPKRQTDATSHDEIGGSEENRIALDDVNEDTGPVNKFQLAYIIIILFVLLPAAYYSKASPFLGAFLAGLSGCQQTNVSDEYNHELAKIIQWLMRIFFGAYIAFVIPVQLFGDAQVIANGFLLSLALLGKIATGPLLTPTNLGERTDSSISDHEENQHRHRFDKRHLRDSLVVGFSMSGEAEFAMVVASFGLTEGLFEEDIYASTVFAILLSTVLSPCLLRLTLAFFEYEKETIDTRECIPDDADEKINSIDS